MKVEIKTPSAGESVSEAIVAAIFKENGQIVRKDEEILELETDKVNQIVHAPEEGLLELQVSIEQVVHPGEVLGTIDTSQQQPKEREEKTTIPEKPSPIEQIPPQTSPITEKRESDYKKGEKGIRQSVEDFVSSVKQPSSREIPFKESPPPDNRVHRKRLSGLRRTIAKKLVAAKNETAMLTTFNEVDMSEILAIRKEEKEHFFQKHNIKLGFTSFFVKACVAALAEVPAINAFLEEETIVYHEEVHIGISVSTDRGLMVPVIKNCESLSFAEIEKSVQNFAKKAREGSIAITDLQGGTFTLTNGGVFGSMLSTPILNPPQSGILGMHNIIERPIAVEGKVVIRPMMYLALSYDHRIVDGKESISFLVKVKELLEKPERILLDF